MWLTLVDLKCLNLKLALKDLQHHTAGDAVVVVERGNRKEEIETKVLMERERKEEGKREEGRGTSRFTLSLSLFLFRLPLNPQPIDTNCTTCMYH